MKKLDLKRAKQLLQFGNLSHKDRTKLIGEIIIYGLCQAISNNKFPKVS